MFRKIVVPLDGSPAAECVLDHVHSVAGKGTEVILVRVVAKPHYDYLLRDSQLSACLDEEFTKEAGEYLAKLAASVKKPGLVISTCILAEQGPVADIIQGFAQKTKADLIAISAHGKTGFMGRLLGSVAERIVHHAKIPVLMVHP
ncbi:MAG: universal stress protein [Spirochaetia bacterium]|jgi:nucleotide-binding universal stress UspA family protein